MGLSKLGLGLIERYQRYVNMINMHLRAILKQCWLTNNESNSNCNNLDGIRWNTWVIGGPAVSVIQSDEVSLGGRVKYKVLPLWDTMTVPSGSLVNSPEVPDWACCKTTNRTVQRPGPAQRSQSHSSRCSLHKKLVSQSHGSNSRPVGM